jgi:hypothetical protein
MRQQIKNKSSLEAEMYDFLYGLLILLYLFLLLLFYFTLIKKTA